MLLLTRWLCVVVGTKLNTGQDWSFHCSPSTPPLNVQCIRTTLNLEEPFEAPVTSHRVLADPESDPNIQSRRITTAFKEAVVPIGNTTLCAPANQRDSVRCVIEGHICWQCCLEHTGGVAAELWQPMVEGAADRSSLHNLALHGRYIQRGVVAACAVLSSEESTLRNRTPARLSVSQPQTQP